MEKREPVVRRTRLPEGTTLADLDAAAYAPSMGPVLVGSPIGEGGVSTLTDAEDMGIPFASQLCPRLFREWHRYAFVERQSLRETIEAGLELLFAQNPLSDGLQLPAKKAAAVDKKINEVVARRSPKPGAS